MDIGYKSNEERDREQEKFVRGLRITLEVSEPEKKNDVWWVEATTLVFDKEKAPIPGIPVQFYLNGSKKDSPEETEGDGRAKKEMNLPLPSDRKEDTVEAQIVSSTIRAKRTVRIKEEDKSKKRPDKLFADAVGGNGIYQIYVSVVAEDRTPIKGALVRIFDGLRLKEGKNSALRYQAETDKYGTIKPHKVEFKDKWRELIIEVPGFKTEILRLSGPSKWKKVKEIPEPTKQENEKGFFSAFKAGWKQAGEDIRKERGKK